MTESGPGPEAFRITLIGFRRGRQSMTGLGHLGHLARLLAQAHRGVEPVG